MHVSCKVTKTRETFGRLFLSVVFDFERRTGRAFLLPITHHTESITIPSVTMPALYNTAQSGQRKIHKATNIKAM